MSETFARGYPTNQSILWHRLDQPGHEAARLSYHESAWHLNGTAVFAYEQQPCRLDYLVVCNEMWHTEFGRVEGWVGDTPVEIKIVVDVHQHWWVNEVECSAVAGCIDLDLNFSPSTNLLPIRRLDLAIGQAAEVRAAWLRFPNFVLEPLEQVYHRNNVASYRYESAGGTFVADLSVTTAGLVSEYPNLWRVEAGG